MILDKLFNKNKSEKYFLEIGSNTSKKAEPKQELTETATVKEEKPEVAKVESTQTQPEAKPEATTEKSSAPTAASTSTPSNVSYDLPEWVKAIKNYSQPGSLGFDDSGTGNNFAGKYVSNNVSFSRRRPGPSLNKFKDIASKMSK